MNEEVVNSWDKALEHLIQLELGIRVVQKFENRHDEHITLLHDNFIKFTKELSKFKELLNERDLENYYEGKAEQERG